MLDDPFADLEGQVKTVETRVAPLQMVHDAKCVPVVLEAVPEMAHLAIELFFADVSKRRMTEIVRERESLGEFFVEAEGDSYGTGYLGDFDRVGQAIAKVIGQPSREDLCLTLH